MLYISIAVAFVFLFLTQNFEWYISEAFTPTLQGIKMLGYEESR